VKNCLVNIVVCLLVKAACNEQVLPATAHCRYVQFALLQKYHGAVSILQEKYNENYMAIWEDIAGESYTIPETTTDCLIHVVKVIPPNALPKSFLGNLKNNLKRWQQ
jgi:hypothetical protein